MDTILKQAIRYAIVGVTNTAITFVIYYILTEFLSISKNPANFTGYAAGLVNGFIWNKQWTFRKKGSWFRSAVAYLILFAICYSLQMLLFNWLNKDVKEVPSAHLVNFLLAMLLYNGLFFLSNKYIAFRDNEDDNLI
jgi:putative flippase GtrA